jgi:ribosome-binding protein aMBF1 (putative translation factor)
MARSSNKARTRSLHDSDYASFVASIVAHRDAANLSQRDVAAALGWNQSIVAKIETTQRRLDVIEFIRLAAVIGFKASSMVEVIEQTIEAPSPVKPRRNRK